MLKRYSSNAAANILSGVAAAFYQLGITAVAVKTWQGKEFTAWALAMSIAAIAPILSLNLSSVVTRRLVEANSTNSFLDEAVIVLASRRIGWGLAAVAFIALLSAGTVLQSRSASVMMSTYDFLTLLAILLLTNTWLILWQVRFGQYYAYERNWMVSLTVVSARCGGILGLLLGIFLGDNNLIFAAAGLCLGTWTALSASQWLFPGPILVSDSKTAQAKSQIHDQLWRNLRVLSGFAVGAASSLIIQYSIPPLISLIAPVRFSAFYLASTFTAVALGVLAAAMSALLAPFTRWHNMSPSRAVRYVALLSPALCASTCLLVLCVGWFGLDYLFGVVEPSHADKDDIQLFIALLGLQAIVRTSAAGFATYVSSAGSASQMGAPLLIEMVLAFSVAVPFGWFFGVNALMLALTFAGFIGSLYSSKTLISLCPSSGVSSGTAFISLLSAQLVGSTVWLTVVGIIKVFSSSS